MRNYRLSYEEDGVKKYINIKAKDKLSAQNKALKMKIKILDIKEHKENNFSFFKISEEKLVLFFKELSLLCEVGFSVAQALDELKNDKFLKEKIKILIFNLNNGISLSLAFGGFNLNKSEISLIKMAENTGKLSETFQKIAILKEKNIKNKKYLKKALQYPLFVFFSAIFAFLFLMLFVVPEFKLIFDEFGANLPFVTKIMIFVYEFLDSYFLYVLLFFIIFVCVIFYFYKKFYYIAFIFDLFLLKIPFIKSMIIYNQNYHFFMVFAMLLKSGVSAMEALNLASFGIKNKFLYKKYEQILFSLKQGLDFQIAFQRVKIFDMAVISMLLVASKSGKLEHMSEEIAKFYEEKQEQLINKFLSLLEPLLTLLVASLVLFLALGVFLPMWELNSINN